MTTGTITITGLEAHGRHGVFEFERELGQRFIVDLELTIEWPTGDELASTVDYGEIAMEAVALVTGEPVALLETLARNIAGQVLTHEKVLQVSVQVHKPDAPIPTMFENVTVTFTQQRVEK